MRGTILQPGYFPWLGFFNQMALSDIFVFYDTVQFDKRGWRNRNRIKGCSGPIWLTVPVITKGCFDQELRHTRIDNTQNWVRKHLQTIRFNYHTAPFFSRYFPEIEHVLNTPYDHLTDLDLALINLHLQWLQIDSVKTMRSSELTINSNDKTGRLVEICNQLGITDYISGPLCKNYLDVNMFLDAGISVHLHEYEHPEYSQLHGSFVPYMASLDLLFNEGDLSLAILKQESALVEYTGETSTN
jgi:hypothetical protein